MNIPHPITYQNELLTKAIEIAGSQVKLASILNVSKGYITRLQKDRMASGTLLIHIFDYCEIAEVSGKEVAEAKIRELAKVLT